jgi:glutathione S-transferase
VLTVHHLERSRSHRVLWLLEELEVPYEIVSYRRDPKTLLAPPELAKVHPLGKSPVITNDGDTVAESGAILEYLVDRFGKGRLAPEPGTPEHLRYRYFMHYAEGTLMPPLLVAFICGRVRSAPLPFFAKPIARKVADGVTQRFVEPNLRTHIRFLEEALERSQWFAGDAFTAADVQMSYPVEGLLTRAGALTVGPKVRSFIDRIHERPAFERAVAKGGPFAPA